MFVGQEAVILSSIGNFFVRVFKRIHQISCDIPHFLWACLHEGGGPKVGEVTCGGLPHLTCKRDHIKMRDCTDRRVTSPKRVTSPTWGPPPPCKQALRLPCYNHKLRYLSISKSCN